MPVRKRLVGVYKGLHSMQPFWVTFVCLLGKENR
jgi:hypothetical protein